MTTEQKSKLSKNLFQKKVDSLGQYFFTLFVELRKSIIYFNHMFEKIGFNLIDLIRVYIIKKIGARETNPVGVASRITEMIFHFSNSKPWWRIR